MDRYEVRRCSGHSGFTLVFLAKALLAGFSFRAGEHTTSAVRKIAGPTKCSHLVCQKFACKNVPFSIVDDSYTLWVRFSLIFYDFLAVDML